MQNIKHYLRRENKLIENKVLSYCEINNSYINCSCYPGIFLSCRYMKLKHSVTNKISAINITSSVNI